MFNAQLNRRRRTNSKIKIRRSDWATKRTIRNNINIRKFGEIWRFLFSWRFTLFFFFFLFVVYTIRWVFSLIARFYNTLKKRNLVLNKNESQTTYLVWFVCNLQTFTLLFTSGETYSRNFTVSKLEPQKLNNKKINLTKWDNPIVDNIHSENKIFFFEILFFDESPKSDKNLNKKQSDFDLI